MIEYYLKELKKIINISEREEKEIKLSDMVETINIASKTNEIDRYIRNPNEDKYFLLRLFLENNIEQIIGKKEGGKKEVLVAKEIINIENTLKARASKELDRIGGDIVVVYVDGKTIFFEKKGIWKLTKIEDNEKENYISTIFGKGVYILSFKKGLLGLKDNLVFIEVKDEKHGIKKQWEWKPMKINEEYYEALRKIGLAYDNRLWSGEEFASLLIAEAELKKARRVLINKKEIRHPLYNKNIFYMIDKIKELEDSKKEEDLAEAVVIKKEVEDIIYKATKYLSLNGGVREVKEKIEKKWDPSTKAIVVGKSLEKYLKDIKFFDKIGKEEYVYQDGKYILDFSKLLPVIIGKRLSLIYSSKNVIKFLEKGIEVIELEMGTFEKGAEQLNVSMDKNKIIVEIEDRKYEYLIERINNKLIILKRL